MSFTVYGSPFRNSNSGIEHEGDSLNNRRLNIALQRFWASKEKDENFQSQIRTSVSQNLVNFWQIAGPITGLAAARVFTDLYCSPKFFYFRYSLMAMGLMVGYSYGLTVKSNYNHSLYVRNFALFPPEIQRALENGDARYCVNWWKDN